MSFGSDNEPSGQQVVQQNNSPWSGQQPFLEDVFGKAQNLYNAQVAQPMFPNSTVVPFSNQTNQALQTIENRAVNGSPLNAAASSNLQQTLGGDFLSSGNPYFSAMADRVRSEVLPSVQSGFNAAGRTGSGLANRAASLGLGDAIGKLAFDNYTNERGKQMQGIALAPQAASQTYVDAAQLANVGATREGLAAQQLQEEINRYNYPLQNQANALNQYAGRVAGGSFGSNVSTTSPLYNNSTNQFLGTALGLASLGNRMFGGGSSSGGFLSSLNPFKA